MNYQFKYCRFRTLNKGIISGVFLSVFTVFFFTTQIFAQSSDQKPELKFQRIHEGLVSNRVSAVYQDGLGYMWMGTYSGLHRYDGLQFQIYSASSDTTSVSDNYIGAIYEDKQNHLWIGTGNGVARYNRDTNDFTRFELSTGSQIQSGEGNLVNTILEDNNNRLWVSGGGSGLYFFDRENQEFIPFGNFDNYSINSITAGHDNILWLATSEMGVAKLNTATGEAEYFKHIPDDPRSISSNSVDAIIVDTEGNLWAGSRGSGLNKMVSDNGNVFFVHYRHEPGNPFSLGNNDIFCMYIDRTGNLWIGNENGGLHLYNKEDDYFFRYESDPENPTSLTDNSIWSIYQDRQERYWIGTAQSGINMSDPYGSKFNHFFNNALNSNSLNNDVIRDFLENDNGSIWIATDGGGINLFDRENGIFKYYKHDINNTNSLRSDAVISLNKDDEGNLWVGTWGGGINILIDEENGIFTSFNDLVNNYDYPIRHIFDVHFDERYVWIIAFEEGLYRYNTESGDLQLFNSDPGNPSSLSSNLAVRIFEDSQKNLWVGTTVGLNLIKAENKETVKVKRYLHSAQNSNSIPGNSIRQIIEDQNQNIWIATDNGLSKYVEADDHFINYYQTDGLPVNEINSIIEDDHGILWIGTINGISRFDPINNTFTNYDQSDGLQGNEFSRYSVLKTQNGELLFGGLNGFNLFHPGSLDTNPYPPPVFLTDLRLFNRSVDIKDPDSPLNKHISAVDELVLSYRHSVVTFDFIALNYTRPEHNQYAYMVEGFEEDWNYVGAQHNATYTNLAPGKYVFRVKAANNDGLWNETGASLALIITPPFWQTTWFYLLTVLFFSGLIFTGYRLRVRSIREHNRQLERQVADRTDELEVKNRDLEAALIELEAAKDELVEKAHKAGMADVATGVLHNVGNILNSVNTSTALIKDTIKKSKIDGFVKANAILREHIDQLDRFIAENPKGRELMHYYLKLEKPLREERDEIVIQSERLEDKINLINDVIAAQQTYAGASIHASQTSLNEMIDNALALQAGSIERHGLIVKKDLQATDTILAQRSKLIHVLVNLFKNAKEAMAGNTPTEKKLFIKTWQDEIFVYLSITDNGPGIKPEHLNKIFTQGFTTKQSGHGFGLHSCANYMTEMGGKIVVENQSVDNGSTFTLSFPIATNSPAGMAEKNSTEPAEESEGT